MSTQAPDSVAGPATPTAPAARGCPSPTVPGTQHTPSSHEGSAARQTGINYCTYSTCTGTCTCTSYNSIILYLTFLWMFL
jgi:hypothetical protein